MKICLVSPYDFMHPGGVTEHVRHLSDKLRRRGHQVTVLAPSSRIGDDHGIPGYVRIGRSVPTRLTCAIARQLLATQWFTRDIVLDRWFLRQDEAALEL